MKRIETWRNYGRSIERRKKLSSPILLTNEFVLLTGTANLPLACEIGRILKLQVDEPINMFDPEEREVVAEIKPDVTRKSVVIIQPTSPSVNDHLMELLIMINAAKLGGANEITAVVPYFGYARQDRKDKPRVSVAAKLVADMIVNAGATRIMTLGIHADQTTASVNIPWDNLSGCPVLVPEVKPLLLNQKTVVASVDIGDARRAQDYAKKLGLDYVIIEKSRKSGQAEARRMIGDVDGADVLLVDDVIASGRSIIKAADLLKRKGARKIVAAVDHGLFLGDALNKLEDSPIEKIVVTDTINHKPEVINHPMIQIASVAGLIAEAIRRNFSGQGISELLQ